MTREQLLQVAEASRLALTAELDRSQYDPRFVAMAIQSFARTYDADPVAGRTLLDRMLDPHRIPTYGRFELEHLAHEADHIHDAGALEEIYRVLFSDISVGAGRVALGAPSVLMGLVQDASQALQGARYALAQRYGAFLDEHPGFALRALARIADAVTNKTSGHDASSFNIQVDDRAVRLDHDFSNLHDQDFHHIEDWWTMVTAFEDRLRDALDNGDTRLFDAALVEFPSVSSGTFLWRILLRNGGRNAVTATKLLRFATDHGVMRSFEFAEPVAEYYRAAFSKLESEEQDAIRQSLLSLPASAQTDEGRARSTELQREYAAVLPRDALQDADPLLIILEAADEAADEDGGDDAETRRALLFNGAAISQARMSRIALSKDARKAGASPELIAAIDQVSEFFYQQPRKKETLGRAFIEPIREIDSLSRDENAMVRTAALDIVAFLMLEGLRNNGFSEAERAEILPLAIEASRSTSPAYHGGAERLEREEQFARHPSWGSPAARIEAVETLWILYSYQPSIEILDALRPRQEDSEPAVRMMAVEGAGRTRDAAPDTGWEFVDRGFMDPNGGVWPAALRAAQRLGRSNPERVASLFLEAFDRVVDNENHQQLRLDLMRSIVGLAFEQQDAGSQARLEQLMTSPWLRPSAAKLLVFEIANGTAPATPIERRRWAAEHLQRLVARLLERSEELRTAHGWTVDTYPGDDKAEMRSIIEMLSDAAQRIYFASGIIERPTPTGMFTDTGTVTPENYAILRPILAALGSFPFAATSYHVVKTLWGAIDVDPGDVLLLGCSTIMTGIRGGLLGEQLAEDDVRAFVMRYVNDHRGLLESDEQCLSALMDVVDAYIDAGWPDWLDVINELDNIYRSS